MKPIPRHVGATWWRTVRSSVGLALALGLSAQESSPASSSRPATVITAGADWVALRPELEIEPGSALDFSALGWIDGPAGKHGRVIARPDGQFAFADSPGVARRFYGVNLCFGAQYLAPEECDRLAERLARLGYNALRIHHYEGDLTQGQSSTTTLNPARLDQLDRLTAALIERGLYLTTDLFVSRSVPYREVGIDRDGRIPMDTFKVLVPVHDEAYANWQQFARALLDHVNPYTKRRYADEPALAWLSMINEGNFGNFLKTIRTIPEWNQAWNRWLGERYGGRAALADAWTAELKPNEDPAQSSVALPENIYGSGIRTRDCIAFFSATERRMVARMTRFLREELKCPALISNANSWTYFVTDQSARAIYDYVDDHFYVDHPEFLEGSWRLPSRCANTSPIAGGATGGRSKTFTRLFDKPFTITEYNYSGPGRFRGVGGILTGAMGALQGWGGIWRFAYSHGREAMFNPSRMGYFDLASDPLSQAAERASLCLFLRGDLQTAPHSVAVVMTEAELAAPPPRIPSLPPKWHWLAWVTRVGTEVRTQPASGPAHDVLLPLNWHTAPAAYPTPNALALDPYGVSDADLWSALQGRNLFGPAHASVPSEKVFRSETGEILIDAPRDQLVLDTPKTAGGYAPAGPTVEAPHGGVRFRLEGSDATVWASALDQEPLRRSHRILVTHLTDLQNTEIKYAEPERKTLLAWGQMPHLVRAGKAQIGLRLEQPETYAVWALTPSGRRAAAIPTTHENGFLSFTADVAADPAHGARMLYEVTRTR